MINLNKKTVGENRMKMWKTNLIAIVMLLSCGSLSANLKSFFFDGCGYFDGFYVGAAGGVATNHAKTEFDTASNIILEQEIQFGTFSADIDFVNKSDNDIFEIRPWGEVFVGWGKQCSCFYLGGRFGINFSNFDLKTESSTGMSDIDVDVNGSVGGAVNFELAFDTTGLLNDHLKTEMRTVEYTLDFKPGIVFCDRTMVFGIIGAAFNRAQLKGHSKFDLAGEIKNFVIDPPANVVSFSEFNEIWVDKKKASAGFRGGLGIEYMLNRCLGIQLSYVYTHYWSLSESDEFAFTGMEEPITDFSHEANFSTKTSKQVASIGIAYHF